MIGRCVKHTERCVLKNLLEFLLLSRSLAWIYASINQNCKIPHQTCGRGGTRTPSLVRERIYSPCGYQLPVTLPKLMILLQVIIAPVVGLAKLYAILQKIKSNVATNMFNHTFLFRRLMFFDKRIFDSIIFILHDVGSAGVEHCNRQIITTGFQRHPSYRMGSRATCEDNPI